MTVAAARLFRAPVEVLVLAECAYAFAGDNPLSLSFFLFFEERGFEGSPRPREGRNFMPFPHREGATLGLIDGAGGCGQGLAD